MVLVVSLEKGHATFQYGPVCIRAWCVPVMLLPLPSSAVVVVNRDVRQCVSSHINNYGLHPIVSINVTRMLSVAVLQAWLVLRCANHVLHTRTPTGGNMEGRQVMSGVEGWRALCR